MGRQWLLILVLALAGGLAGLMLGRWLGEAVPGAGPPVSRSDASGIEGTRRPAFELRGVDGNLHDVSQWDGELLLINFWATWCAPCREEMPMLDELQAEFGDRGLQVVGIALDTPSAVQSFTRRLGIGYPVLVDGATGDDLMRRYGNSRGVLPYSVLVGRDGTIERTLMGALHREDLVPLLKTHL